MSRRTCSACGAPVAAGAAFCSACGAPAPPIPITPEDASSWLRRRWWLAALVLLLVAALASLLTWVVTRDSDSKSGPLAAASSGSGSPATNATASTTTQAVTASPSPTRSASEVPSPTPTTRVCGAGAPEFVPATRAHRVLVTFFRAIDDRDYATAYGLLSADLQHNWASAGGDGLTNFSAFYGEHLRCVTVTSIAIADLGDPTVSASLGIQWYEVRFEAEYSSPLPAGSGRLLPFYRVQADPHEGAGRPDDRITGEGSGP